MAANDLIKGNLNLIILTALAEGDKYGYEITRTVLGLTEGEIQLKEGSLYPSLHKLEKQKLVEGYWVQQDPGKPARKYYRITEEGRMAVGREKEKWKAFLDVMGRVIYGKEGN